MSYFVTVTFDIKNGSREDYQTIYEGFETFGLSRRITSSSGKEILLPTTTTAGQFDGQSASSVRDYVDDKINETFESNLLHGEVFISVGDGWAWAHRTP